MTALAVCTIGVWIRCDWDFKEYVHQLEMYHFWTGAYILIAASVIVMVLSAFGCFGAITENPFILSLVASVSMKFALFKRNALIKIDLNFE